MAYYRHEWSDHVFQTPEASATVLIMLPASAFDADEFESGMRDAGYSAVDRGRTDEADLSDRRDDAGELLRADMSSEEHGDAETGVRLDDALGSQQQDGRDSEQKSQSGSAADVATKDIGSGRQKTDLSEAQMGQVHASGRQVADASREESDIALTQEAHEMKMAGLSTRGSESESVGREQLAAVRHGVDRAEPRHREDASDDRVEGFESVLRSGSAVTADKRGDYFSQGRIRAMASRDRLTADLPNLRIQKRASQSSVLAGRPVDFEVRLENTRTLVLQDIVIVDPQPEHLEFVEIRHAPLEWLIPPFRRVRTGRDGHFVVRGPLRPGESVVFRTRYRSMRPNMSPVPVEID